MDKKIYTPLLIVFGITALVVGFFGGITAILRGTLTNQIILGAIFILGILLLIYGIELRK